MKRLALPIMVLLFLSYQSKSQELGVNFSLVQATGDFNQNIDRNPMGIALNYTHGIGQSKRLNIGGELGLAMYSYSEYTVETSYGVEEMYEEDCFWTAHAIAQYNLYQTPMATLYAEGRVGMTTFFSSREPLAEDSNIESEFNWHGTAFNSGLGGGIKLNLSGLIMGNAEANDLVWLNVSATMNSGSQSKYRNVSEGEHLTLDDGQYKSLTHYAHFRIGMNFKF